MKTSFHKLTWFGFILFGLVVAGCAGKSAPTQFYMLGPVVSDEVKHHPANSTSTVYISLDTVEIPEYLNRPQLVTHVDRAEYQIDEFHRWMEPLQDNLTRMIANHLSVLLNPKGIDILYTARPVKTEYTIFVQVLRMEGKLGQGTFLDARWSFFDQQDETPVLTKRFVRKRELSSDDKYQGLLQAQNRSIESLCRAMADGINQIVVKR
jgi:uncharacterized lipoprotein YmbA